MNPGETRAEHKKGNKKGRKKSEVEGERIFNMFHKNQTLPFLFSYSYERTYFVLSIEKVTFFCWSVLLGLNGDESKLRK